MTTGFGKKLRNLVHCNQNNIPHICFTCEWFRAKKQGDNRYCKFPGKLNLQGNICLSWQLEPDPKRRVLSVIELQNTVQSTTP